jgi:hypothetical protein
MNHHLKLLGCKARDKVTGYTGTIASVCFDLYGCVQAVLTPSADKDGKLCDGHWFDVKRLELLDSNPVMSVPSFVNEPGPQEKPAFPSKPVR